MKKSAIIAFGIFLLAIQATACREQVSSSADAGNTVFATVIFELADKREVTFDAEVVTTPEDRAKGLMFRKGLKEADAMLFVFDSLEDHVFWMKNTFIPLDMIFITPDMLVAGVVHNATPQTLDGRSIGRQSLLVLEISGGLSKKLGITEGARIRILPKARQQSSPQVR